MLTVFGSGNSSSTVLVCGYKFPPPNSTTLDKGEKVVLQVDSNNLLYVCGCRQHSCVFITSVCGRERTRSTPALSAVMLTTSLLSGAFQERVLPLVDEMVLRGAQLENDSLHSYATDHASSRPRVAVTSVDWPQAPSVAPPEGPVTATSHPHPRPDLSRVGLTSALHNLCSHAPTMNQAEAQLGMGDLHLQASSLGG